MKARFSYVKYDETATTKQQTLKTKFEELEALVEDTIPEGRAKSLIMTHLEEAYMWTGKGIRDEQTTTRGANEQPERAEV